MIRRAAILALCLGARIAAAQSPAVIELREPGPGPGPELVARELARPYAVVPPAPSRYLLRRDTTVRRTLVVLGRDAYVDGRLQGDLIVVGGDLFMHPGGVVTGRAIAVGGGVYESTLASTGPTSAFRDFTYDVTLVPGGYILTYRSLVARDSTALAWPGLFGLRLPSYDRSNGLSLPFGPSYHLQNTGLTFEPRITYRSQLGNFDPSLDAVDSVDRRTAIRLLAERTTMSNERWIWSDFVNSVNYLLGGSDMREYYRATRLELTAGRRWESANGTLTPYAGALYEQAESVRPLFGATSAPWTLLNRHDPDDALRPNPLVPRSRIVSGLAGAAWDWSKAGVDANAAGQLEAGSPTLTCDRCTDVVPSSFAQATLDGRVEFPTFGTQTFRFQGHGVLTTRGNTPLQRVAFLGGPGTLPTLEPLPLAGNELLFADFRYNIPVDAVQLPFVGPPTLTLREALGGADSNRFPTVHQSIGARVSASVLYVEVMLDPVVGRFQFGLGLSTGR